MISTCLGVYIHGVVPFARHALPACRGSESHRCIRVVGLDPAAGLAGWPRHAYGCRGHLARIRWDFLYNKYLAKKGEMRRMSDDCASARFSGIFQLHSKKPAVYNKRFAAIVQQASDHNVDSSSNCSFQVLDSRLWLRDNVQGHRNSDGSGCLELRRLKVLWSGWFCGVGLGFRGLGL